MLLSIKRLDGKTIEIDSTAVFRMRPAIKSVEHPSAVAVVHYDPTPWNRHYEILATRTKVTAVAKILASALPMVKLTSPIGAPVYLDADKIVKVEPADKKVHFPKAKAVLYVKFGQSQQVSETVAEAKAMIEAARRKGPANA